VQEVINYDRAHCIELEVALRSGESYGRVISNYLDTDHDNGFTLGRIDLPWHDGRTGLILGQVQFADTAARPGG
jgi:hypothetical protein